MKTKAQSSITLPKSIVLLTSLSVLVACGGGDGGGGTTPPQNKDSAPAAPAAPTPDAPAPDAPTPDAPTPDAPTPDAPTPDAPAPATPTPAPAPDAATPSTPAEDSISVTILPTNDQVSTPQITGTDFESDTLTWLNYRRQLVGLPSLKTTDAHKIAAQKHAQYTLTPFSMPGEAETKCQRGHDQNSVNPAYYATTPADRLTKAGGNSNYVGEVFTVQFHQHAGDAVDSLIDAVYHRMGIFTNFSLAGAGFYKTAERNCTDGDHSFVAIMSDKAPSLGKNKLIVYPPNNTTDARIDWYAKEYPTPVPQYGALVGYPISLQTVDPNQKLTITDASIKSASGQSIDFYKNDSLSDANMSTIQYAAALIPKTPLTQNTEYTVTVSGKLDNKLYHTSWKFKTAAAKPITFDSGNISNISASSAHSAPKEVTVTWSGGTGNYQQVVQSWTNVVKSDGRVDNPVTVNRLSATKWLLTANNLCLNPSGCDVEIGVWDSSKPLLTNPQISDTKNPPNNIFKIKVMP